MWIDDLIRGVGAAIADARQTLVQEGWFGRHAAEPPPRGEPPMTLDVKPEQSLLDWLYGQDPSLFVEGYVPERDHGIESVAKPTVHDRDVGIDL